MRMTFRKMRVCQCLPPPLNWLDSDSVYGADFNAMYKALDHIKATGQLPKGYTSWYQDNIMTIEEGQGRVRNSDGIKIDVSGTVLSRNCEKH
jgi:hypothetical protein